MDPKVDQFTKELAEMIRIQDQIKRITKESLEAKKELKPTFDNLEGNVMMFMNNEGLDSVVYGAEKIELRRTERPAALNRKSLLPVLEKYFENEREADEMMDFIDAELGSVEKIALRRVKQKQPKARAKRQTKAAAVKQASDADNNNAMEDEDVEAN